MEGNKATQSFMEGPATAGNPAASADGRYAGAGDPMHPGLAAFLAGGSMAMRAWLGGGAYAHPAAPKPRRAVPCGFDAPAPTEAPRVATHRPRLRPRRLLHRALAGLKALGAAALGTRIKPVSDARFSALIADACFAQYFRPVHDPREGARFAQDGDREMVVLDLSPQGNLRPLHGLYLSAGKAFFARVSGTDYAVRAIALDEQIFGPWSRPADWQLAKYYLLMGLHAHVALTDHPRIHYPDEVIRAVSAATLPPNHLLAKLLHPFLQGPGPDSHQGRRHACPADLDAEVLPMASDQGRRLIAIGFQGLAESVDFPPYRFGAVPRVAGAYRAYLDDWYRHLHRFVRRVTAKIPAEDPFLAVWADQIAARVPGFPNGEQMLQPGVAARAVTGYLLSITVRISADRYAYARVAPNEMPMRLRLPPPSLVSPTHLDPKRLVGRRDYFRHCLYHARLQSGPAEPSIAALRFGFHHPELKEACAAFVDGMPELDRTWAGKGFPPSTHISGGIPC